MGGGSLASARIKEEWEGEVRLPPESKIRGGEEMEWMKMESLGDKALFLNYTQSAIVNNPSMWGGQSNSIYYTVFNQCYAYSIDHGDCQSFPFIQGDQVGYLRPFFWFFPHLSHDENLLQDDM
ncbi:hypothetical protein Acr_27g0008550 [Actinidia rufa]|uniref:KIB1-4 beta-propeller domain-containing protein n=1 Tax=Actinidia rufa TaxID=165716 RepID=A0A7J0H7Q7_9ERIC|nr:hypothetical protein Acr_27g0008550 [Actinidia rufa]